jgi:hypothetical protein
VAVSRSVVVRVSVGDGVAVDVSVAVGDGVRVVKGVRVGEDAGAGEGVSVMVDVRASVAAVDGEPVVGPEPESVVDCAVPFPVRLADAPADSPDSSSTSVEGVITRRFSFFDRTYSIVSRNAEVPTRPLSTPTV